MPDLHFSPLPGLISARPSGITTYSREIFMRFTKDACNNKKVKRVDVPNPYPVRDPLNTRYAIPIRIRIIIAIIIFSQGSPWDTFLFLSRREPAPYPLSVAVTPPPLLYEIPVAGRGFFFHVPIFTQLWLGGSLHTSQNFPPQCWQENGSTTSLPQ